MHIKRERITLMFTAMYPKTKAAEGALHRMRHKSKSQMVISEKV